MKAIMVNVSPSICERVTDRDRACTILVKKSMPKIEGPFKCYIYCTEKDYDKTFGVDKFMHKVFLDSKGKQKVIGEFICDQITQYNCDRYFQEYFVAGYIGAYMPLREMSLTQKDLMEYGKGESLYGWHISNLTIYDEPKELTEFFTPIGKRPSYMLEKPFPSWGYIEDKEDK